MVRHSVWCFIPPSFHTATKLISQNSFKVNPNFCKVVGSTFRNMTAIFGSFTAFKKRLLTDFVQFFYEPSTEEAKNVQKVRLRLVQRFGERCILLSRKKLYFRSRMKWKISSGIFRLEMQAAISLH